MYIKSIIFLTIYLNCVLSSSTAICPASGTPGPKKIEVVLTLTMNRSQASEQAFQPGSLGQQIIKVCTVRQSDRPFHPHERCFSTCMNTHTHKSEPWTATSYLAYIDWTKQFLVSFRCHCIRLSIGKLKWCWNSGGSSCFL